MIEQTQSERFFEELQKLLSKSPDPAETAVQLIAKYFLHYQWIGIYWLHGDTLVLGPYKGLPTEHFRISVGAGVCGTAVVEEKNQIVRDVTERDNYLACSLDTKSEIVVLIRQNGKIIGQFDADSDEVGSFDETDEAFLEQVAIHVASGARVMRQL